MKRGQSDPSALRTPKPLMKLKDRPIIEHTVSMLSDLGLEICVVVKPQDLELFRITLKNYRITFCVEEDQLGTAHALYAARNFIRSDLFLVSNGDDVFCLDLPNFGTLEYGTIFGYGVPDVSGYGAIKTDEDGIASEVLEKKVIGPGIVNTGVYAMPKLFFDLYGKLEKNEQSSEFYLTDAVSSLYSAGAGLRVRYLGYWAGINTPIELESAELSFHTEIEITEAHEDDLDGILRVVSQLSTVDPAPDMAGYENLMKTFNRILESEVQTMVVAKEGGEIVGTATLIIQDNLSHDGRPYGHIENVVTDSAHRRRNVGRRMVNYLVDLSRERGCYKVILNCSYENVDFYWKCGFQKNGEVEMRIDI